ncbi:ankyrin repeat domain protein [Candidatus Rickettsiella viridis]|uniref:Ankyrin repeat domain protein n=1 Tax=Candidatus Rickettsiella viridis TaxID=676208 RepID=A0A2Z5UX83_9COXI|nr:ankyrin repeat domain-containing protein [Candidatus Rickettsiella viridis]BBB15775.1 ankyrin repeat domain protein [Candidatus Rickettsiella viridis]
MPLKVLDRRKRFAANNIEIAKLFTAIREHGTGMPPKDKIKKIINLLRQISNINDVDSNDFNNTPLHVAAQKGHKAIVELLIKKNAGVTIRNTQGKTAIDLANELALTHLDKPAILQLLQRINPPLSLSHLNRQSAVKTETHAAGGLKHSLHGALYQLKLHMLFLKRGLEFGYSFRLAVEWDAAEKFDDLVFQYMDSNKKKYRFLQAKHKLDETKKIGIGDLLTKEKNGEFNLEKYFVSYLKITNNPAFNGEFEDFIICTNSNLDLDRSVTGQVKFKPMSSGKNKGKQILVNKITDPDAFFIDGGSRYKLQISDELIAHLENSQEVIKEIQGKKVDLKAEINEFLDKLVLAVNQPNEKTLSQIITRKLGEQFNLIDADFIYDHFEKELLAWMKEKGKEGAEGTFFTLQQGNDFFSFVNEKIAKLKISGPTAIYNKKLKDFGVVFNDNSLQDINNFLRQDNKQILNVLASGETRLSAIKVNQAVSNQPLYHRDDSYIFVPLNKLLYLQQTVLNAFQSSTTGNLLIVICKNGIDNLSDLYANLKTIIKENTNKKLILITEGRHYLTDNFIAGTELTGKVQEISEQFSSFSELTTESQTQLLKRSVNFQGSVISLSAVVGTQESLIDGKLLAQLVDNGAEILIGPSIPQLSEEEKTCFLERTFSQVEKEGRFVEIADKVAVIVGRAGMEKSIVLTYLANREKETYPHRWVIKLDLKQYNVALSKENFDHYSLEKAIDFLIRPMDLNYFDKALLKKGFYETNRVSLFFDRFESISAHQDKMIQLLKLLNRDHLAKLWITTRPYIYQKLERALSVSAYKLNPLLPDEPKEFLKKFFEYKLSDANTQRLTLSVNKFYEALVEKLSMAEKILSVPHQLKIAAEALQTKFKEFYNHPQTKFLLPNDYDLLDLYEEYFKTKFDVYSKDIEQTIRPSEKLQFSEFIKKRTYLAFYTLFGSEKLEFFYPGKMDDVTQLIRTMENGGGYVGVVDNIINGTPQFSDRSFAEYLAAKALVLFIHKNINHITASQRQFLQKAIYDPNSEHLRNFFNCVLTKDSELHRLIYQGDIAEIKQRVANRQLYVNTKDSSDRSALSLAASAGEDEIVEFLLAQGASVFQVDKVFQWTPLAFADATYGNGHNRLASLKIIDNLLEYGSDKKHLHSIRDFFYDTANRFDYESAAELLREIVQAGHMDLLHASLKFFDDAMLNHHKEEYSEFISGKLLADYDKNENTLLHYASDGGYETIVFYLLEKGSDPTIKNKYGKSSIDLVIEKLNQVSNEEQKQAYKNIINKQLDTLYSQIAVFYQQSIFLLDLDSRPDQKMQYYQQLLADVFIQLDEQQIKQQIKRLCRKSVKSTSLSDLQKKVYGDIAVKLIKISSSSIRENIRQWLLSKISSKQTSEFSQQLQAYERLVAEININDEPSAKRRRVERLMRSQNSFNKFTRLVKRFFPSEVSLFKALSQAELLHADVFRKQHLKTAGHCLQLTYGFSELILRGEEARYANNLQTLSELEERIIHRLPLSRREEQERAEFLVALQQFETQDRLPSWRKESTSSVKLEALINSIAAIEKDFAIHLSLKGGNKNPGHMLAIYRRGQIYTYFDSNIGYLSQIHDQRNFLNFVQASMRTVYDIKPQQTLLMEHYSPLTVLQATPLSQPFISERTRLSLQDQQGKLQLNGQAISRIQLYDLQLNYHEAGNLNLPGRLIDAETIPNLESWNRLKQENKLTISTSASLENLKYCLKSKSLPQGEIAIMNAIHWYGGTADQQHKFTDLLAFANQLSHQPLTDLHHYELDKQLVSAGEKHLREMKQKNPLKKKFTECWRTTTFC